MPTLLVTKNMSPALAARVQAAVSGRRGSQDSRRNPLAGALRVVTFVLLLAAAAGVVQVRRQRAAELEAARASLLTKMRSAAAQLSRADLELKGRAESAVALHAVPLYPGDLLADELRSERGLHDALSRPTLYIRGPLDGLANAARLAELAASSFKDALVACLLDAPDARTEQALRRKASAKAEPATAQVERLAPLLQALPLLGRAWQQRVESAATLEALSQLQKLYEVAPIPAALRAAKARQILIVMDEAGAIGGPTELDGERAHPVRLVLVDLTSGEVRLRFRRNVDPSWLSDNARAQNASGIDSCTLAFDLHQAIGR
ncbi:MAG TPA: hypothetical protein VIW29_06715 [Polyangiaceae bacterium]